MQRRGVTVLVGGLLVAVLIWGVGVAPVPYVTLGPGPTVDTLGTDDGHQVIEVSGRETSTSAGQLRLVTVSVLADMTLLEALRGWLSDEEAVVPRELIYPPNETEQQVEERNQRDFQQSQSTAETTALRELGFPVLVTVADVLGGSPAEGKLVKGDVITSVDGEQVTSGQKLRELVQSKPAGTAREVAYTRGGTAGTATITTAAAEDGTPRIGIQAENTQPHPFTLKIDLDRIGGPSAGLMFALGIIDKLEPADLTGGLVVAGTGTIDEEGGVGPIGGVPQKLVAAKGAKATVFLTPDGNCAEAVANAVPGLKLVRVATLDEALAALEALRSGRDPVLCGSP